MISLPLLPILHSSTISAVGEAAFGTLSGKMSYEDGEKSQRYMSREDRLKEVGMFSLETRK